MNTTRRNLIRHELRRAAAPHAARRRGSVLVVVLALLSALMLLGFLFYTSASQERANARYFAASEKFYDLGEDSSPFDFPLEQIILGPRNDYANSVLWGGRYSLLAGMVGSDVVPYSGPGVNLVDADVLAGNPPNGIPAIDQDHNGTADVDDFPGQVDIDADGIDDRLALNMAEWSVEAAAGTYPSMATVLPHGALHPISGTQQTNGFPQPDVGYSYPDLNSLFLSYEGTEPMTGTKVIIPSFHRPQYLRGFAVAQNQWYINPITSPYTLRPHQDRPLLYYDDASGTIVKVVDTATSTPVPRFHSTFWGTTDTTVTTDPKEGYWDRTLTATNEPITQYDVNADNDSLDVDNDGPGDVDGDGIGDGTKEAILLDLGHPVAETPDGSLQYIPLYGVTIREIDSLLNLNAHGNLYGIPDNLTNAPPSPFISRSNEGRHTHEINPIYGFTAPVSEATGNEPPFFSTGTPTTIQLANIEFWFTLVGRAELDTGPPVSISKSIPGRWGERTMLETAILTGNDGTIYGNSTATLYPRPGISDDPNTSASEPQADDPGVPFGDQLRGLLHSAPAARIFPTTLRFLAPAHPEDHQGQGTYVTTNGVMMNLVTLTTGNRVKVPAYLNYYLPHSSNSAPAGLQQLAPRWLVEQVANGFGAPIVTIAANFGIRGLHGLLVDNPGETILNPESSNQSDSIFGPGETAALHMSDLDFSNANMTSRLIELVPANFKGATGAPSALDRRQRFTTASSDLKSYSYPHDPYSPRAWETRAGLPPAQHGGDFPPYFGTVGGSGIIDVFRREARAILQQSQSPLRGPNANNAKGLVRKLSVNQVAALAPPIDDATPEYILRPLTPHPTVATNPTGTVPLGRVPIPVPSYADADADGNPDSRVFGVPDQTLINNGIATWQMTGPVDTFVTAEQLQEWHARRDRQNMARDIYTLLYTFSNVDPTMNVTTTSNARATPNAPGTRPIYTDAQLREMAQFAVNVVDAMDPDDTITLFVYDKDLVGIDADGLAGYTRRDDGYSDPPDYITDLANYSYDPAKEPGFYENADRGMVFGVEAQQLAFSEVLAVFAKAYDPDDDPDTDDEHAATEWKDIAHRDFVYAEIQNMTPWEVRLDGGWSIVCDPNSGTYNPPSGGLTARSLTILGDSNSAGEAVVEPGSAYTIGTAGDSHLTDPVSGDYAASNMMVDPNSGASGGTASYLRIAPAVGPLDFDGILADPTVDEDVNLNLFDAEFPWKDGDKVAGNRGDQIPDTAVPPNPMGSAWLDLGSQDDRDGVTADVTVTFTLRRRANLHREFPRQNPGMNTDDIKAQRDNPWIVVDSHTVDLSIFDLDEADTATEVQTALADNIDSEKRGEPLDRDNNIFTDTHNVDPNKQNSLGGYDDEDTPANIWQCHFDRSFASLADLLLVPLYGPKELTADITTATVQPAVNDPKSVAAARFLYPDGDIRDLSSSKITVDKDGGVPGKQIWDKNLWYRLFEFVEVPDHYGNPNELNLPWFFDFAGVSAWTANESRPPHLRRFGKININMLRYPHVLAGVLDDTRVVSSTRLFANSNGVSLLRSANSETMTVDIDGDGTFNRGWWDALLFSRDGGFDPITRSSIGQNVILPGLPMSEPFRSFSVAPTTGAVPNERQIHNAFSKTFLRSLVGDDPNPATFDPATDVGRRTLFALGNKGTVMGSTADLAARYRLLGKVLKHGTTRSNTYVIFMTCDYYEAIEVDPTTVPPAVVDPVYQIGPKIPADSAAPEEPRYRGVFVVDRTLALQMLEARDLPQNTQYPPAPSQYRTFSYARDASSGSPQSTFDWQELVIYSKIIKSP